MNNTGKRLLWVDDEIEFLRSHIMFMEEHGYVVEKATNGDDAVALIKSIWPILHLLVHLVICRVRTVLQA